MARGIDWDKVRRQRLVQTKGGVRASIRSHPVKHKKHKKKRKKAVTRQLTFADLKSPPKPEQALKSNPQALSRAAALLGVEVSQVRDDVAQRTTKKTLPI